MTRTKLRKIAKKRNSSLRRRLGKRFTLKSRKARKAREVSISFPSIELPTVDFPDLLSVSQKKARRKKSRRTSRSRTNDDFWSMF